MKFLHINHRYAPFVGGSERYVQEVSEALASSGHDVNVVTSDAFDLEYFWNKGHLRVDAPSSEMVNGVHVSRVPVVHPPLSSILFQGSRRAMGEASRARRMPLGTLYAGMSKRMPYMPALKSTILSLGPVDLIHATNIGIEGPGLVAMEVARSRDVPLILTPFIHLGNEDDNVARRYVTMPHQITLLKSAQALIVMTKMELSFLESLGIDGKRVIVSGVGVAPDEVTGGNRELFRAANGVTGALVGVASAVAFDKGSRELVLAVADLRRRGHDLQLVLAGPRLGHFDAWFNSLPDADRAGVILPGFISAECKRDMLAAIDVLTMPSRTESFGIAYLEGWINAKPVIAARAGAVPELVRDGETGMLVEFGDVQGISDAILRLIADKELSGRLAAAGRELVLSRFTWDDVVTRIRVAYSQALGFDVG